MNQNKSPKCRLLTEKRHLLLNQIHTKILNAGIASRLICTNETPVTH